MLETLIQDLRFAFRLLMRRPGFTAVAVLSLALGIGANTVIFSLINQIFLQPLPIEDPRRVVAVNTVDERVGAGFAAGQNPLSHLNWRDLREQNEVFAEMAAYDISGVAVTVREETQVLPILVASGNYFETLGVKPAEGRFFADEEDSEPGRHPVVVLHHQFWLDEFGGSREAIGQSLRINGQAFTVIGVAPPGFDGVNIGFEPALWTPQAMNAVTRPDEELNWYDERRGLFLFAFARLAEGVDLATANANLAVLGDRLESEYPDDNQGRGFVARPIAETTVFNRDGVTRGSALLMSTVALVLLIACVNVANLLLARAMERRREIAVRLAAGVSRGRLVRQLLTESVVIALLGGVMGIVLALLAGGWLGNLLGNVPGLINLGLDLELDRTVLGFTLVLSLVVGLLFGLIPALQASKPELVSSLKDQGEGLSAGGGLNTRTVLVVAQLALSMVALAAAGLFVRSFAAAQQVDLGYDTDRLLSVGFDLGMQGFSPEEGQQFLREVRDRTAALPGAERVAVAQAGPLQGSILRSVLLDGDSSEERTFVQVNVVGPDYFETMGIPLPTGRAISEIDREGAPGVVVVNETMAQRFWPGENPVGRQFRFFGMDPVEVIGVARDIKYNNPGEDPQPYAYLPLEQQYVTNLNLVVRSAGEPGTVLLAVQELLRERVPDIALLAPGTIEDRVAEALVGQRFTALFLATFGGIALVLAAIGIYGVMAYVVRQRRREIGIRMALGAERSGVSGMILRQGLLLAVSGLVIGVALALVVLRLFAQLLFVDPADPMTLVLTGLVLLAAALAATWMPAVRAARVDPVNVLRP
ncbi:MAG: hypothetical protein DWQ30_24980 [Acidobacteria bacterium]|nr:MAG: hypothetical protein DWQ30_24980 [Acidobacteriota bacterium]